MTAIALPLIGGFVNSIANYQDTMAQARQSRENAIMQYHIQSKLNEDAYKRNLEMWHMQNMYNSPAEQMKRFGEAGLNPHLIYGQGTPGNAQAPPQYVPPEVGIRFQAPRVGAALTSAIPMLMQIGSWMQSMRAQEVDIQQKVALFPALQEERGYRRDISAESLVAAMIRNAGGFEEYLRKYGSKLELGRDDLSYLAKYAEGSGERDIEIERKRAEARLKGLQVEYYEPALIMKAVLGLGLGGMIGKFMPKLKNPIKAATKGGPKPIHYRESETIKRVGRTRTHTRSWIGE